MSKNALTAATGIRVETLLCSQPSVKTWFTQYFNKPIKRIAKIEGRKKSDIQICFEDDSVILVQNKNGGPASGSSGGRGWSIDRRNVNDLTNNADFHTLLESVCLKKGSECPTVSNNVSRSLLALCLLGGDPAYMPDYFTHTRVGGCGDICELAICDAASLIAGLTEELYETVVAKRTCVHLSPSIYFQRKGGDSADANPDQIQTKMRLGAALAGRFVTLAS